MDDPGKITMNIMGVVAVIGALMMMYGLISQNYFSAGIGLFGSVASVLVIVRISRLRRTDPKWKPPAKS